jgi:LCP family protein required for cell wall assembly
MASGYAVRRVSTRGVRGTPLASGSQRALFAFALITFFLASSYTGLALLSRVTPALFPGRSLKNVGVVAALDRVVSVPEASAEGSFQDPIRILVLGLDRRPEYDAAGNAIPIPDDANGGYNTDVFMVVSIDPLTKKSTLLSFPRDMWVDITAADGTVMTEDRINTSYGRGVRSGGSRAAGIDQVRRDLKENFAINFQYYAILDFKGVEDLVDAIGGVSVDVPPELAVDSWFYSDDDIHGQYVSFPPGINQLDGYHAVAFGRHRAQDSDLERVKRQQLVIKAALEKSFSAGIIAKNPLELWDAYNGLVTTDVPRTQMLPLADLVRQTNGTMQTYSLGDPVDGVPTMIPFTTAGGAAVLKWVPENVQYWLARAFPVTRYPDASVELQNGYGDPDLGGSRTAALGRYLVYSKGLVTVFYGDDVPAQARTTVVLARESQRKAAQDIASWLGLGQDRVVANIVGADDTTTPDITVIVGRDFVIPGTQ